METGKVIQIKAKPELTIVQKHTQNFETLRGAFLQDSVGLVECTENSTGEKIAVICAISKDKEGTVTITPFAKFFNGNPYELLTPPI